MSDLDCSLGDAERLRTYLDGWDDATNCWRETMSWVPDEHLVFVVRTQAERVRLPRRCSTSENVECRTVPDENDGQTYGGKA